LGEYIKILQEKPVFLAFDIADIYLRCKGILREKGGTYV
jgi:hypothetical protein